MARRPEGSSIVSATGPSRSPRRPQPASAASGSRSRSRRRAALLFGGAAVSVAVVAATVIAMTGSDSAPVDNPMPADAVVATTPSATSPVTTSPDQPPASGDPAADSTGRDCSMPPGGQDSGENTIRAFEHRLYVERSGAAAHEVISPNAPAGAPFTSVANLDAGIAATPVGSTYCLDLDPVLSGIYTLTVSLVQPDGTPGPQYRTQRVTTSVVDGRHVIESITEVGE